MLEIEVMLPENHLQSGVLYDEFIVCGCHYVKRGRKVRRLAVEK